MTPTVPAVELRLALVVRFRREVNACFKWQAVAAIARLAEG